MRMGLLCVAVLALGLAGCGGVQSDHPLSDASTSVLDERLIGVWEIVPKKADEAAKPQPRAYVGKLKDRSRVLELVTIDFDEEKHLVVNRWRLYTTKLGHSSCFSLGDKSGKAYFLFRYTLDAKGRLWLQALDEDKVAAAIRAKKIAGRVKEHPKDEEPGLFEFRLGKYEEVRLTAPTKALRAWLEKNPGVWTAVDEDASHCRKVDVTVEITGK